MILDPSGTALGLWGPGKLQMQEKEVCSAAPGEPPQLGTRGSRGWRGHSARERRRLQRRGLRSGGSETVAPSIASQGLRTDFGEPPLRPAPQN